MRYIENESAVFYLPQRGPFMVELSSVNNEANVHQITMQVKLTDRQLKGDVV